MGRQQKEDKQEIIETVDLKTDEKSWTYSSMVKNLPTMGKALGSISGSAHLQIK